MICLQHYICRSCKVWGCSSPLPSLHALWMPEAQAPAPICSFFPYCFLFCDLLQSACQGWVVCVLVPNLALPFYLYFPTSLWGFCFLPCTSRRPRPPPPPPPPPPRAPHLTHLTLLISHNSSHTNHLTQLTSHITSHTQLISHNSSHTTHLTPLISHNSPHTTHLTHNSSHTTHLTQLIPHTIHLTHNSSLTQLISHNSSQLISHTTHLTQLISHTTHLTHHISHTTHLTDVLLGRDSTQSFLKELRRGLAPPWPRPLVAWQAQYTEPPEGAAARIGAAVAASACCVAGAVHRASWRSCGADWRRRGRGYLLRGSIQSLLKELARIGAAVAAAACCTEPLKELRRGLVPPWPRPLVAQAQCTEPPEGAAARIGAAVAASACCVAGAVHRASWRSCGADWRRSGRGYLLRGRRST